MPTYRKRGNKVYVEIYVNGHRKGKTFNTKYEAKGWAESYAEDVALPKNSLYHAFHKYANEVSPTKKGARWEQVRLNKFANSQFAKREISSIEPSDIAKWRDSRLKEVSNGTVRREIVLLASVFEIALKEWGWVRSNPCRGIKKPSSPPARRRGISQEEIDRICEALGYSDDLPVTIKSQEVAAAFLLGIETAMRASEILRSHLYRTGRVVRLPETKNGTAREIPLSPRAVALYEKLPNGFTINSASLDAIFRKAKKQANVDCTFHDSRGEAITRLSRKLDVLQLAKMVGHKDVKSLLWYYSESSESIADKL